VKFHYPKHLKTSPHFVGLSLVDLVILVVGLLISLLLNLKTLTTLALLIVLIGGLKIISLKFPRRYFTLYYLKRKTLKWRDCYLKIIKGLLI
jgi:hypothetical protein